MGTVPPPYNPQNDPRWQREQARAWRDHSRAITAAIQNRGKISHQKWENIQ